MAHLFLFADEAGDFTFRTGPNISKYYIICTVAMASCDIGTKLLNLRRRLAWRRAPLGDYFHAAEDKQEIRDAVFAELATSEFSVQTTIMEKSKAQPQTRISDTRFYKYGWHYHFENSSDHYLTSDLTMMITVAS